MFENKSEKQLIIIYAIIAIVVALVMAVVHYFQGWDPIVIVIVANIWFFCLFYILYLPIKVKRSKKWYRIIVLPIFVAEHNPHIIDVKTLENAKEEIRKIGSDTQSIEIMAPKAISRVIKLENVVLQDAIIIKQDMLSIGGEVAVPKNTFELHEKAGDILVIGTIKQLNELVDKLNRHYPRIKNIGQELAVLLKDVKWVC